MEVKQIAEHIRSSSAEEREELLRILFDDEELREDMLDYAALLEAEAEEGEAVTLEEFLSGKRTYSDK